MPITNHHPPPPQKIPFKQCIQKVQPQNDKLYGRLPFVWKKESCLYDINIRRTFSDHNLSDANSSVALPHSEASCRLLFTHVSITDWWYCWYPLLRSIIGLDVTRTIPKYGERRKKKLVLDHVTRNWLNRWLAQITSQFGNLAVKSDRI